MHTPALNYFSKIAMNLFFFKEKDNALKKLRNAF